MIQQHAPALCRRWSCAAAGTSRRWKHISRSSGRCRTSATGWSWRRWSLSGGTSGHCRPPLCRSTLSTGQRCAGGARSGCPIVPCGGMAANALGLTTQVPVRQVYLTSGPNRHLKFGELAVELRHAPRWQLTAPHRPAGEAVRALAWLGPEEVEAGLEAIRPKLSAEDMRELAASRAVMPAWMAEPVSAMVADGISQTT